jgi:hypothetical protein
VSHRPRCARRAWAFASRFRRGTTLAAYPIMKIINILISLALASTLGGCFVHSRTVVHDNHHDRSAHRDHGHYYHHG